MTIALVVILQSRYCCGDDEPVVDTKKISALILQLGNESFHQRESAEKQLIAIGEPALPQLSASQNTKDAEIAYRVSFLINAILKNAKISNSIGLELALIDAGEFTMGSSEKEFGFQTGESSHQVKISRPFMIGTKEVTQDQFGAVMGFKPSWFSSMGKGKDKVRKTNTGQYPVDSVTWFDAIVFCNKLSERDKLPAHYAISEIEKEGARIVSAKVKVMGGSGYRLPSEAEWEYACRAGTTTPFHFGTKGKGGNFQYVQSGGYGTRRTVALGRTTRGGSYKPNAWGLYDMHGNVAEWCFDWYSQSYYSQSPEADPPGPDSAVLSYKVLRGGSFLVGQGSSRSATRFYRTAGSADYYAGFRVARNLSKYVNDAMNAKSK